MHLEIYDKEDCCGCTACVSVCPKQCIKMHLDEMGFLYPVVNSDRCVDCGLCVGVCHFSKKSRLNVECAAETSNDLKFYAAQHRDDETLKDSQSGACFTAISDWVLSQGGVVYGAVYTPEHVVVHSRAASKQERDAMRGSKYAQSDIRGVFRNVKQDLQSGLFVLFVGTPCQIAGLSSFIKNGLKEKLILTDIICHGVASPKIWEDVIKYTEKKYKSRVVDAIYRDKRNFGWRGGITTFKLADKRLIYRPLVSIYNENVLRESCYNCPYATVERKGDLTIGDFWGVENVEHSMFVPLENGVSLILCNTEKGQEILNCIKNDLTIVRLKPEDAIQMNLRESTRMPKTFNRFRENYKRGFEYAMLQENYIGFKYEIRQMLFRLKRWFLN